MAFLLEHQPPRLHLVIASRADPALALAGLRARGAARRDPGGRPALHRRGDRGLPQRADGAGADRAATSPPSTAAPRAGSPRCSWRRCRCRVATDASAFIAGFAGDDRYIVDYLAEEVLARQSADVRDFLLETSILDRLSGPLCDAVTGRARRPGDAGGPGARQPVPGAARRPAPVVALSPPLRRRPPGPPAGRAGGRRPGAAPARERLVRAARRHGAGRPARAWRPATSIGPPT